MKAIQIVEPGKIKLIEKDLPIPVAGEVLLKIKYVGFCGSDLSTYLGRNPMVQYPRIPGHEISALIEGITSGIPDHFKKGQKVRIVRDYPDCSGCHETFLIFKGKIALVNYDSFEKKHVSVVINDYIYYLHQSMLDGSFDNFNKHKQRMLSGYDVQV